MQAKRSINASTTEAYTSMKSKGLGDETNEELKLEYKAALDSVKQGYAEAIEAEQIPPGYRGSIQSYFDSLGPPAGKK